MSSEKAAERLILRGGISAGLGFLTRFGARFLFLFVAGQLYGATLFGAFAIAVAVVELAATLGGVGMRKILFQLLDRNEEQGSRPAAHIVIDGAILVTAASLGLAAVIVAAIALLPPGTMSENSALALTLLAPAIAGQALLDLLTASTRWKHRMRYEVVSRSLIEPYAGVAAAAAAYFAGWSEIGLALSYWVGTLAALLFSLWGTHHAYGGFALASYRTSATHLVGTLRGTAPNTGRDFVEALFARLDLYLVGILLGEAPAGIYNMARQLRTPVRHIRQSLDSLLTPITARTLGVRGAAHTGAALASATRLVLAVQLPVLLVLFVIGAPLLEAFGPGFSAGYWAMLIVTAAEMIQSAFGISGLILVYRGAWLGFGLTALWTLIGIAAGLLLIPPLGIEGAALSVLIAYSGMALHRRSLLTRRFHVRVRFRHSAGPVVAALLGLAASIALQQLDLDLTEPASYFIAAVAALAVYAAALLAWMFLSGERLSIAGFVAGPPPSEAERPADRP